MHIYDMSSVYRKDTTLLSMIINMPSIYFFLPIYTKSLKHETRNIEGKHGGLNRDNSSLQFLFVLLRPFKLTLVLRVILPEVR